MKTSKPKQVIVGIFSVPGYGPDSVETPLTGKGKNDYAALDALITARHPKVKKELIKRTGSAIELRGTADDFVTLTPGMTIGQLFDDERAARTVGRVFLDGSAMDVVLINSAGTGTVGLQLSPILRTDGVIRFHNRINSNQLANVLPVVIKDILGNGARDLKLKFREAKPSK